MSTADLPYRPLQDGLRAAGHYLDRSGRRLVGLIEVDDGIVVSLLGRDAHQPDEAILLTRDDLVALWAEARAAQGSSGAPSADTLFPTGYEDFLRALGDAAARQKWPALRLLRLGDEAVLRFGPRDGRREMSLSARDIQNILNRAFAQRGKGPLS